MRGLQSGHLSRRQYQHRGSPRPRNRRHNPSARHHGRSAWRTLDALGRCGSLWRCRAICAAVSWGAGGAGEALPGEASISRSDGTLDALCRTQEGAIGARTGGGGAHDLPRLLIAVGIVSGTVGGIERAVAPLAQQEAVEVDGPGRSGGINVDAHDVAAVVDVEDGGPSSAGDVRFLVRLPRLSRMRP